MQEKCSKLGTKQSELDSDSAKTNEEMNIAKQVLEDANSSLDSAISEGNMVKMQIAREMIALANEKYPPFLDILKNRQRSGMKSDKEKNLRKSYYKKQKKSYKLYLIFSHN